MAVLTAPEELFRNAHYVILNKPAGLPVHAGPRGGASVEDWFPMLSRRRDGPWLAHRLDADTAGCLLVALRKAALVAAQAEFAAGRVEKEYWAVVQGGPAADAGSIDLPLLKRNDGAGWRMVVDAGGAPALTEWEVQGRGEGLCWLALRPRTGRTHQLRVHCAAMGWPIVGDAIYGGDGGGLMLLARRLRVGVAPEVAAEAPVPGHMAGVLRGLGEIRFEI